MSRTEPLNFTVFYDDEGFTDDAKKAKEIVAYLVDYLESGLGSANITAWRGFYKERDGLPGENKLRWCINVLQRAQNLIFIITPNFLIKKWLRIWN